MISNLERKDLCEAHQIYWKRLHDLSSQDYVFSELTAQEQKQKRQELLIEIQQKLDAKLHVRLEREILQFGPLETLLADEDISEILVNSADAVWFEKGGRLHKADDLFFDHDSYKRILDKICDEAQVHVTLERPHADGKFRDFRVSLVGPGMTSNEYHLSLRRHPKNPWTLERLAKMNWCSDQDFNNLKDLIHEQKNFLVVGGTGSGKTSLLSALLQEVHDHERVILIEDTWELPQPNDASIRLLTRPPVSKGLDEITQTDLIKKSLRLRPDRLVMGEIRGAEAKDFLLMLSTGHQGSMGTLHANDPQQALARLEMLVQMGAPEWSLMTIRRLIFLSLQNIVIVERTTQGERKLKGIYQLQSLEEWGFLIEKKEVRN